MGEIIPKKISYNPELCKFLLEKKIYKLKPIEIINLYNIFHSVVKTMKNGIKDDRIVRFR